MSRTKRLPLGPVPLLIEVPEGCYASLWGSVPFAMDQAAEFRPWKCLLVAEHINHVENARRLTVKAVNDERFGVLHVTFHKHRVHYRTPVDRPEQKGEHTNV
jgi:hypothetical protein